MSGPGKANVSSGRDGSGPAGAHAAKDIEAVKAFGQRFAGVGTRAQELEQPAKVGVIGVAAQQPAGRIGVVQAPKRMQHVADLAWMVGHPGRVLARDDGVVGADVQFCELAIAVDHLPEAVLGGGQFDDVGLVGGLAVEVGEQAPPQLLGTSDRQWNVAGRHDDHVHAGWRPSPAGLTQFPVRNTAPG